MNKFLVTGATGLIGSAIVKNLLKSNKIVCPVRNIEKAFDIFKNLNLSNVTFIKGDLLNILCELNGEYDYIIHGASPTASKFFVTHPTVTITFGFESTRLILDYCKSHPIKGMVYLSSLESYGTVLDEGIAIDETYQGYVDPLSVRSSYNIAKRTCEALCHAYAMEYGIPVKIARLTQTISSEIQPNDMRIFAQFARAAANGDDIELHTSGQSARQYVYVEDAVDAILSVLYLGHSGEAYNVANDQTYISALDMAFFVQRNFNPSGDVVFNLKQDMGYAPQTKIKLDVEKLKNLGWSPKYGLKEMYSKLILNLRNIK